jgi:hypothetical protein
MDKNRGSLKNKPIEGKYGKRRMITRFNHIGAK